jgi:hypothetical protein
VSFPSLLSDQCGQDEVFTFDASIDDGVYFLRETRVGTTSISSVMSLILVLLFLLLELSMGQGHFLPERSLRILVATRETTRRRQSTDVDGGTDYKTALTETTSRQMRK